MHSQTFPIIYSCHMEMSRCVGQVVAQLSFSAAIANGSDGEDEDDAEGNDDSNDSYNSDSDSNHDSVVIDSSSSSRR